MSPTTPIGVKGTLHKISFLCTGSFTPCLRPPPLSDFLVGAKVGTVGARQNGTDSDALSEDSSDS
jgi:hypothetical protein